MHIVRLKISGFRGVRLADITLGRHAVLVGPNNSGKTTVIEALALLFGRDRLVRRLTEHDFHSSAPDETARILCIATVTGFTPNDPHHHSSWFSPERGVEKWFDPNAKTLGATLDTQHTDLAVQIGFAARFDLDELEAETIRFFVDDEATLEIRSRKTRTCAPSTPRRYRSWDSFWSRPRAHGTAGFPFLRSCSAA